MAVRQAAGKRGSFCVLLHAPHVRTIRFRKKKQAPPPCRVWGLPTHRLLFCSVFASNESGHHPQLSRLPSIDVVALVNTRVSCSTCSARAVPKTVLPPQFVCSAAVTITLTTIHKHRKPRPSDGEEEQKVVAYAFQALDALGVKFGPTHTGGSVARPISNHLARENGGIYHSRQHAQARIEVLHAAVLDATCHDLPLCSTRSTRVGPRITTFPCSTCSASVCCSRHCCAG